jgi:multiple sugar transport system substrate-binding protein
LKSKTKVVLVGVAGFFLVTGCGGAPPGTGGNGGSNTGAPASGNAANSSSGGTATSTLSWSGTSDPSLKGQTITVLWTDTNGLRGKMIKQFEQQTGIHVKEIGVDYNSVYNKVTTAAMANSSDIDVAEMDTIWAGQYFKGNIALDLSNIIPQNVQSEFTSSSLSSVTYNGHLMGIPWFSSSKHLFYNTALLRQAGITSPPKTWDAFYNDSLIIQKKLGSKGIYASAWSWKQAESLTCDYVGFLGAYSGQFFDSSGKPLFDQAGGLQALQYMQKLMKSGTLDPASLQWTEQDVQNAFMAGKIAMMSNWEEGSNMNDPHQSVIQGKWKAALLPGEGSVVSATCTGSEGLAIMKNSKHQEAALAFLKWIAGTGYQTMEYQQEGQLPSLNALYPVLEKQDKLGTIKVYQQQYQYGVNRPNAPGYVQWSDILSADLHNALVGQGTAQSDLQDAATKIQQAISNS